MESRLIPTDVWSVIAEFVEIQNLPVILVLSKSICKIVNSDHSWCRRCKRKFPIDQVITARKMIEREEKTKLHSVYRLVFQELSLSFKTRTLTFPNFSNAVFVFRNKNDTKDIKISEPDESFRFLELKEGSIFSHREMNQHLKDWFDCDGNLPNFEVMLSSIGSSKNQKGDYTDVSLGLVRFILPNYRCRHSKPTRGGTKNNNNNHENNLVQTRYYSASTSTCYGCFSPSSPSSSSTTTTLKTTTNNDLSKYYYFTSCWVIDCRYNSWGGNVALKTDPNYCIGQSTMCFPPSRNNKELKKSKHHYFEINKNNKNSNSNSSQNNNGKYITAEREYWAKVCRELQLKHKKNAYIDKYLLPNKTISLLLETSSKPRRKQKQPVCTIRKRKLEGEGEEEEEEEDAAAKLEEDRTRNNLFIFDFSCWTISLPTPTTRAKSQKRKMKNSNNHNNNNNNNNIQEKGKGRRKRTGVFEIEINVIEEFQFHYIRGKFFQEKPEKSVYSVCGSIQNHGYVSIVVCDWKTQIDEFYLVGKFIDEKVETSSSSSSLEIPKNNTIIGHLGDVSRKKNPEKVKITGLVVLSRFMDGQNSVPRIDGLFDLISHNISDMNETYAVDDGDDEKNT